MWGGRATGSGVRAAAAQAPCSIGSAPACGAARSGAGKSNFSAQRKSGALTSINVDPLRLPRQRAGGSGLVAQTTCRSPSQPSRRPPLAAQRPAAESLFMPVRAAWPSLERRMEGRPKHPITPCGCRQAGSSVVKAPHPQPGTRQCDAGWASGPMSTLRVRIVPLNAPSGRCPSAWCCPPRDPASPARAPPWSGASGPAGPCPGHRA